MEQTVMATAIGDGSQGSAKVAAVVESIEHARLEAVERIVAKWASELELGLGTLTPHRKYLDLLPLAIRSACLEALKLEGIDVRPVS